MPIIKLFTGLFSFFTLIAFFLLVVGVVVNWIFTGSLLGQFEPVFYRAVTVIGISFLLAVVFGVLQMFGDDGS